MVRSALAGRNTRLQELVINSGKFRQIVTTHLVSIGLVQEALDRDRSLFLGMQASGNARCSLPSEHYRCIRPRHIDAAMEEGCENVDGEGLPSRGWLQRRIRECRWHVGGAS